MVQNRAAWFMKKGSLDMEVKEAPYPTPGPTDVVIKAHAVAVNPADWYVPMTGMMLVTEYPAILGLDVAGEVHEVGKDVTRFKKGDRVISVTSYHGSANGSFQLYPIAAQNRVVSIPGNLAFEAACVLPLGVGTAAMALYAPTHLNLSPLPSVAPTATGKTVFIWGGSGGVGQPAIQLAKASGYKVAVTASAHNEAALRALGADWFFDRAQDGIVATVLQTLQGDGADLVGAFNVIPSEDTELKTAEIVAGMASSPSNKKFVASVFAMGDPAKRPAGIEIQRFNASDIFSVHAHVGKAVFEEFLPQALAEGKFKALPEANVVGEGLESIPEAVRIQKNGVSAKKVVVKLVSS